MYYLARMQKVEPIDDVEHYPYCRALRYGTGHLGQVLLQRAVGRILHDDMQHLIVDKFDSLCKQSSLRCLGVYLT